jgi:hypothetical protein
MTERQVFLLGEAIGVIMMIRSTCNINQRQTDYIDALINALYKELEIK